jgi:hypothetical protein
MSEPIRDIQREARSYPQDLADIDRGNYFVICSQCRLPFQGFKRRYTCRLCMEKYREEKIQTLSAEVKLLREWRHLRNRMDGQGMSDQHAAGLDVALEQVEAAIEAFDSARDKGEG